MEFEPIADTRKRAKVADGLSAVVQAANDETRRTQDAVNDAKHYLGTCEATWLNETEAGRAVKAHRKTRAALKRAMLDEYDVSKLVADATHAAGVALNVTLSAELFGALGAVSNNHRITGAWKNEDFTVESMKIEAARLTAVADAGLAAARASITNILDVRAKLAALPPAPPVGDDSEQYKRVMGATTAFDVATTIAKSANEAAVVAREREQAFLKVQPGRRA